MTKPFESEVIISLHPIELSDGEHGYVLNAEQAAMIMTMQEEYRFRKALLRRMKTLGVVTGSLAGVFVFLSYIWPWLLPVIRYVVTHAPSK